MTEVLREFCDSRGVPMRVDRESGVLKGVKILGLQSRNGRSYLPDALQKAAALYENAKVNVNHPKGHAAAPRDYQDRLGQIRGVQFRSDEGLFGDLHFNPKHALAEQLAWDAEHAPENVGFSHNVEARTTRRGEETIVDAITRVQSVDLVADPATTRGLFEAVETPDGDRSEKTEQRGEKIDELDFQGEFRKFLETVFRIFRECRMPTLEGDPGCYRAIFSETFLASMREAGNGEKVRKLAADRANLIETLWGAKALGTPIAREQNHFHGNDPVSVKAFVEAIT